MTATGDRHGAGRTIVDGAAAGVPPRIPYWLTTIVARLGIAAYLRVRVEGREHLPAGPAILCFNHQGWVDPFLLAAVLPNRPDLIFFGPREANMSVGGRNRLIAWSGRGIPFDPRKTNLRAVTRTVEAILGRGARIAIAPEGRIHVGERVILPVDDGVAFFALRAGVPIVPVGINGVGWLRFGGRVRVRIGAPIVAAGRPTKAAVAGLSARTQMAMLALVSDGRDREPPGPFGRWLTELFNDWPEGSREAAARTR